MDSGGFNKALTLLALCATVYMTVAMFSHSYADGYHIGIGGIGRDLTGLEVERTYKNRNESFDPTVTYFGGVALFGLPGFILALVALVSLFTFCGCYFGCKKCGRLASQERFSRKQRLPYRVVLGLFVLIIVGGVIVGMYGNRMTTAGVRSITSTAKEVLVEVSITLDNITLLMEPIDPSFTVYLDPVKGQVADINVTVTETDQQVGSLDIFRNLIVHFGFLTALVTGAVGLTAAVTQQSKLALALGIMGLISIFFMSGGFGLHVPVSLVLDDFCQKIDDYLSANDTTVELGVLLSCVSQGTFGDAFDSLGALAQQEFISLNDTTTNEVGYSFDPSLNAANNSLEAIGDAAANKLQQIRDQIAAYIVFAPQDVQDRINAELQRVDNIIATIRELLRIANCKFVARYAQTIVEDVCIDVTQATILIYAGQIILATMMIPYAILGLVAAYKFKRPYPDHVSPKSVRMPVFENPFIFNMLAICAVGITHAVVALTDVNINQWAPIAGLAVFIAVQIFGIIGAAVKNKVMVIIYALLESVVGLLLLGVIIIFAIYLSGCNTSPPQYGPELCDLFPDRTTTINNLILVCFVVVIGIFAVIFSWRLFLHLHRKKTFTHIVRQSTRSHLAVNLIGSGSGAPLPGHVVKPSTGMSQLAVNQMKPVPTAYKGQLHVIDPNDAVELNNMPDQSSERSESQPDSRSQLNSSHSSEQSQSQSESQSQSASAPIAKEASSVVSVSDESDVEETSIGVSALPLNNNEASEEESSEYESDNSSGESESNSSDEDEWSHSEV